MDYFSTVNPFRMDILVLLGMDLSLPATATELESHWQIVQDVFQFMQFRFCKSSEMAERFGGLQSWRLQSLAILEATIMTARDNGEEMEQSFLSLYAEEHVEMARKFLSLLPLLSSATRRAIVDAGNMVLLPHHQSSSEEIDSLLQGMESLLSEMLLRSDTSGYPGPPCLVTIAKSADDGFTPEEHVHQLCASVLNIVKKVYSLNQEIRIVLPYEEKKRIETEATNIKALFVHDLSDDPFNLAYPSLMQAKILADSMRSGGNDLGVRKRKIELLRQHGVDVD